MSVRERRYIEWGAAGGATREICLEPSQGGAVWCLGSDGVARRAGGEVEQARVMVRVDGGKLFLGMRWEEVAPDDSITIGGLRIANRARPAPLEPDAIPDLSRPRTEMGVVDLMAGFGDEETSVGPPPRPMGEESVPPGRAGACGRLTCLASYPHAVGVLRERPRRRRRSRVARPDIQVAVGWPAALVSTTNRDRGDDGRRRGGAHSTPVGAKNGRRELPWTRGGSPGAVGGQRRCEREPTCRRGCVERCRWCLTSILIERRRRRFRRRGGGRAGRGPGRRVGGHRARGASLRGALGGAPGPKRVPRGRPYPARQGCGASMTRGIS